MKNQQCPTHEGPITKGFHWALKARDRERQPTQQQPQLHSSCGNITEWFSCVYFCFRFVERAIWPKWHDGQSVLFVLAHRWRDYMQITPCPGQAKQRMLGDKQWTNACAGRERTEAGACMEKHDSTRSYIFRCLVSPRDPSVKDLASKVP